MRRYAALVMASLVAMMGISTQVGALMTESPLKFSFSHDFLRTISLSSGSSLLSVLDNLKLEDAQHVGQDGKTLYVRGMEISHVPVSGPFDLK